MSRTSRTPQNETLEHVKGGDAPPILLGALDASPEAWETIIEIAASSEQFVELQFAINKLLASDEDDHVAAGKSALLRAIDTGLGWRVVPIFDMATVVSPEFEDELFERVARALEDDPSRVPRVVAQITFERSLEKVGRSSRRADQPLPATLGRLYDHLVADPSPEIDRAVAEAGLLWDRDDEQLALNALVKFLAERGRPTSREALSTWLEPWSQDLDYPEWVQLHDYLRKTLDGFGD